MVTAERQEIIDNDTLLQLSRRLDWRFLLPHPDLRRVAYVGPVQPSLLKSLALFSESLAVLDHVPVQPAIPERYSLVVIGEPSEAALRQAAELVEPGGFLYLEGHGLLRPGHLAKMAVRRLALYSPSGCAAAVKTLGFGKVQAHWHWPDCESCTRIIPLADAGALFYLLGVNGNGKRAGVKSALARWLWQSGLPGRLAPCFSIIAQRGVE